MKNKRIVALIISLAMIFSLLPNHAFAVIDEKGKRELYLHAQQTMPSETVNSSTVYKNDSFNVYFAINETNLGDKTTEPQYSLNGYTVKIYFDPSYFDFDTSKVSTDAPIDYTVAGNGFGESGSGEGYNPDNTPTEIGYYVYSLGGGTEIVNGKSYKTAYATIFFSGEFLPDKPDGQLWYNLCALPLVANRSGSSEVFLEIGTTDEHTLELFAKNNQTTEASPTFEFTAVNSGYHRIYIKDRLKPDAPIADPISGSYTQEQLVTLSAEEGAEIYYSVDGGNTYTLYTVPIEVKYSTEITCYAESADGKHSNTVSYEYKIIPGPPYLFVEDDSGNKKAISNVYTRNEIFTVYVSDKETFGDIETGSKVYYTFADLDVDDVASGGSDANTEWVEIYEQHPVIEIEKSCTVKLITVKSSAYSVEHSDISCYYLGIQPAKVTANPDSGIYDEVKQVELNTTTNGADIYYTLNGDDPRENGIPYTIPLVLRDDVTLRTASYYEGQWSELSSFWYVFNIYDDYGRDAFYPSGTYEGSAQVTLTTNNPKFTIKYSTDDGVTWEEYDEKLVFYKNTELIAVAYDENGNPGDEYRFTYTIKPEPPTFAPESTQFTNSQSISLYCPERTDENYDRYELYYTLDGSDPLTNPNAILADAVADSAEIEINKYTVIKAVVKRDATTYSDVVTHSYDIVVSKPVKPLMTLTPGYYTKEIGESSPKTQFVPVPTGTEIYYTIAYGDDVVADPVPGVNATKYNKGDFITPAGRTVIKAIAVNRAGAKSDIGIFEYIISPEAPIAAPSATIAGNDLPVVPVRALVGCKVKYEIGGFTGEFINADSELFYIDTKTGNAYRDEACTERLSAESGVVNQDSATLIIRAELDGITSSDNIYYYAVSGNVDTLAAPFADKETGMYEEKKVIPEDNTHVLYVMLSSLNTGDTIEYMKDNSGIWVQYDGTAVKLSRDTVLQLRSVKNGIYSEISTYVYEFIPLAPIIVLPSGTYADNPVPSTTIRLDDRAPDDFDYVIWYRANGDSTDSRYNFAERDITKTMSFKAYTVNDTTGKRSKNTVNYYIIEPAGAENGAINVAWPYEVNPGATRYIASHRLDDEGYNEGIKLYPIVDSSLQNVKIQYFYSYTKTDGSGPLVTENLIYDSAMPIFANQSMAKLSITAKLLDASGNEIEDSETTFNYEFLDMLIPKTSLGESREVSKGSGFTIINDYVDDNYLIYYTLDKSAPNDKNNANKILYNGEGISVGSGVTVKTAYFKACGKCAECNQDNKKDCVNGDYGESGGYMYTVPTTINVGGGGGGAVIDKTRKYTKDIFGNEHPTHIGYINGYPDGSVQPEGYITREEITAILYRITNHDYEKPFIATGKLFDDVELSRWSAHNIEYMADKKVVNGYPDGNFYPSKKLSRAEFTALIMRFAGIKTEKSKTAFSDVSDEHWAFEYISTLSEAGYIKGYEDGTFKPEQNITRAEATTVINKILGRKPLESYVIALDFYPFNDLDKDKWYYTDVMEATVTHNYYLDTKGVEYKWEDWK